jgi:hypothetical protein
VNFGFCSGVFMRELCNVGIFDTLDPLFSIKEDGSTSICSTYIGSGIDHLDNSSTIPCKDLDVSSPVMDVALLFGGPEPNLLLS